MMSRHIINEARSSAVCSVEFHRVRMYWQLGERIFVEEQRGEDRAAYGEYLVKNLAVARRERIPEQPLEIIKDPMYLEFFGLKRESEYYEKDIESALITHL